MTRRRELTATILALAFGAGACVPPPASAPMRSIERRAASSRATTLIVFLPGRGSNASTFVKEDFAAIASGQGLAADLVFADATEGYYADRLVVERLHADVIGPARARGYDRVWLVGVSLGGLGAILYAKERPGDIDGVFLLAPYLGDGAVADEIGESGGLARWPGPYEGDGWSGLTRSLWRWLREAVVSRPSRPHLWLGYGRSDRLRRSHELLGAALPPDRVLTTDGGHAWSVWRGLWRAFLDSGAITSARAE